jgi:hypothetical protein
MGSRQAVIKPAKMSLAQFSKTLVSCESQGGKECVSGTIKSVDLESLGEKRFAAEVVAAMSTPRSKGGDQ